MDPQLKSTLTTILVAALGGAGVWATKVGIVPESQQSTFVNMLVTIVIGIAGVALTWWKARQQSPAALIVAVNKDPTNGVKVVPEMAPGLKVNEPQVPMGVKK